MFKVTLISVKKSKQNKNLQQWIKKQGTTWIKPKIEVKVKNNDDDDNDGDPNWKTSNKNFFFA